jgi:hypothetical protein
MPEPSAADRKILVEARDRLTMAIGALSDSRDDELDDLRFAAASPDNQFQWPADVLATRGAVQGQTINARPCLTINKLPEHIHQVTNEQRQNRPAGKVIPASDDADIKVAEVYDGLVRYIEYASDADVAYGTACDNQVTYGEGYARILTEYCDDTSFDQDIKIGRIRNSFSVYMDPTIQDLCGQDAEWCFIAEDILKTTYERDYPNACPVSVLQVQGTGDESFGAWLGADTIRIAEYFYKTYTKKTLNLYAGNMTAFNGSPHDQQMRSMGMLPIRDRDVQVCVIKWIKTNGFEILEQRDWAGKWIPVVRLIGNEFLINGRLYISGLVRNAKDAQRMYNYWVSQEAEMLALAPKAPFIGYGGQFEGYETFWKTANTQNWPYLEVNPDVTDGAGAVLPLPQRAQPPMASSGLLQAKMGAADDIKSATGQYNASLGQTSNERSGKAIIAREHQSAVGTYHYVDNYARFVRSVTRQLVDLIPKVYDTERVARIMGEDGKADAAQINPAQPMAVNEVTDDQGAIRKIYNPGVGKYDVRVTTGPSYVTKRQETQESMGNILQGNPELWKVAGDLFVKNMDWPGAEEMAKRLQKMIDPKLLGDEDNPALQAAQQQIQAMGQELDQLHQMLKNVQHSYEAKSLENDHFKADIQAFDAETKRLAALSGASAAQPVSPELEAVVKQYIREILAQPTLEEEEPASFERGEMYGQEMMPQQPPMQPQMPQQPQGM